jgi:hypothetical protein
MSSQLKAIVGGFALVSCLATLTSGCDGCYASGISTEQVCQQSGAVTAGLASGASLPCPPQLHWDGLASNSLLSIDGECGPTNAGFGLQLVLPQVADEASYALPSSDIGIWARFFPAPPAGDRPMRQSFETSNGSLVVDSGTITIHSSIDYGGSEENRGIDAELEVHLRTTTGEVLSVAGRVVARDCVLRTTRWCSAD